MKSYFALGLFFACGATTIAGTSTNGDTGNLPIEFIWQTPTNNWPDRLWIYKVVPQEFSPAVISNLLALSGFTEKDKTKVPDFLKDNDEATIFYGELEGHSKHLAISPTLGYIDYHNPKAEASSQLQKVEGVPDEQKTTQLGLKYLRLLGIDVSQIARKADGHEFDLRWEVRTLGYVDQTTKEAITLTNKFGVWFARRIDGVKVQGFGGMDISFGNNAKIADLQVCWRNLQPYELKDCPSLQEITEQIRNGKIILYHLGTRTMYPPKQLKKLTITKATPLYEGKHQDKPVTFVRPYATFQGIAEDGQATAGVYFECLFEGIK